LPFSHFAPFPDGLGAHRNLLFNYLQSAGRYLEELGVLHKATFRQIDEPKNDEEYRIARDLAILIHQANKDFRVAVSGSFTDPRVETYFHGRIDTYIMANWAFDPIKAQARLDAGDEVWTYTSLVQNAGKSSPFWELEFPLLHYRVPTWINFRYGLNGLVYWTTDHWEQVVAQGKSSWREPCTFRGSSNECYNGDGSLIYPGREINYRVPKGAFEGASRAEVWGPVPSLRLKAVRDGLEDYEWLVAAAKKDSDAARQAALEVGCNGNSDPGDAESNCFFDFNRNPDSFRQARERLAEVLQQP
jgi:hypothetical protein